MNSSAYILYHDCQVAAGNLGGLLRSLPCSGGMRSVSLDQQLAESKIELAYDDALTRLVVATGVLDLLHEDELLPSTAMLNREVLGRAKEGVMRVLGRQRATTVFGFVSEIVCLGGDERLRNTVWE